MDSTTRDWSSLPEHLLFLIAKRLSTRIDTLCFRAVCNSFRSSVPYPVPPFSDLHYSHNISSSSSSSSRPPVNFVIAEFTLYAIQPISQISITHQTPSTWLLKVEESRSGKVRVMDPFLNFHFKKISDTLPESLNLLDYRVKEISKGYRLQLAKDQQRELYSNRFQGDFFQKVVASTDDDYNEFAIMVLIEGQVAVWRRVDNKWVKIDIDRESFPFVSDIIYHNKKFYIVGSNDRTVTVDAKSLNVTEPWTPPRLPKAIGSSNHLVKSSTELFLIKKYHLDFRLYDYKRCSPVKSGSRCCQVGLSIYKLVEESNEWIQVKDGFQDRALFICRDCNFFLSDQEFSGCKWNCVYLADTLLTNVNYDYPGSNTVIFNLGNRTTERLSAFPAYSKIFWPPPTWLFP